MTAVMVLRPPRTMRAMTADTPPAAATPEAPTKKVYERKTRTPDWLTDAVLVITAA